MTDEQYKALLDELREVKKLLAENQQNVVVESATITVTAGGRLDVANNNGDIIAK